MPKTVIEWQWEDAFDKFGFDDGDGPNFTDEVADAIRGEFGYACDCRPWGIHNYMIRAVTVPATGATVYKRKPWCASDGEDRCEVVDGKKLLKPRGNGPGDHAWSIGYDSPRDYLPDAVVEFLDKEFGAA